MFEALTCLHFSIRERVCGAIQGLFGTFNTLGKSCWVPARALSSLSESSLSEGGDEEAGEGGASENAQGSS